MAGAQRRGAGGSALVRRLAALRWGNGRGVAAGGPFAALLPDRPLLPILASLLLAVVFLHDHAVRVERPLVAEAVNNWFGWSDQGDYLRAALAWSRGDLSVSQHAYMPGFALLAAPFLRHAPWLGLPLADPFLPADLGSLLLSLWAIRGIAGRLAPDVPYARALGTLSFLATMLGSPTALDVWVVPWNTSPASACLLLCLWAALGFHARPDRWQGALWTGLAGAAVAAFRPTDMLVALLSGGLLIAWTLVASRASWRMWLRTASAGLAGVAVAFAGIAAAYLPIYGLAPSPYMIGAARCGFEWRLLPLRWVTLAIDPRPLLPVGHGLIAAFPWLLSGLGAAAAMVLRPGRSGRATWAVLGAAMAGHTALYLCYRDIHSGALWLYFNYHYFKWVVPAASLLSVLWIASVATQPRGRRTRLAGGLCVVAVLLPWRADLRPAPDAAAPRWNAAGDLLIPGGLADLDDAVVYAAHGSWDDMFMGRSRLASATEDYAFNSDYKTIPVGGGLMLVPLRPLSAGLLTLSVRPAGLAVARDVPPVAARQQIVLGLPCLFWPGRKACRPDPVLADK